MKRECWSPEDDEPRVEELPTPADAGEGESASSSDSSGSADSDPPATQDEEPTRPIEEECHIWFDADWQAQIRRSLVVGDALYTVSDKGLLAVDIATFEPLHTVEF